MADGDATRNNYKRHISFDDSCKKDDGDEVCVLSTIKINQTKNKY